MNTYTHEELQSLANDIAMADGTLTPDVALEHLVATMQRDAEGFYHLEPSSSDTQRRTHDALMALALGRVSGITERRPFTLECDVWRFQNKKEKWVAFVGLLDGRPYEIFTGLQDDDEGIVLPKSVNQGWIIKNLLPDGTKRYDFAFQNRRGYKITVEGLSGRFNKEYWNYAKLISGVLRYRMPLDNVIALIDSLQLESDTINTWKAGVVRALKKYTAAGAELDEPTTDDYELPS